jgi:hypothetical protein
MICRAFNVVMIKQHETIFYLVKFSVFYLVKFAVLVDAKDSQQPKELKEGSQGTNRSNFVAEELFIPGTMYFLKREIEEVSSSNMRSTEIYTLWKRNPGEHFKRIMLSGNFISDHKCESHYYALRDVLKSLPRDNKTAIF